jgi:hypothetical protein
VRDVRRKKAGAADDLFFQPPAWQAYALGSSDRIMQGLADGRVKKRLQWASEKGPAGDWKEIEPTQTPGAHGVAFEIEILGEGQERAVHNFREMEEYGSFVGPHLVGKESWFVSEDGRKKDFHKVFRQTQGRVQWLAVKFNRHPSKLREVQCTNWRTIDPQGPVSRLLCLCAVRPHGE